MQAGTLPLSVRLRAPLLSLGCPPDSRSIDCGSTSKEITTTVVGDDAGSDHDDSDLVSRKKRK
jgi:hypothetical protein